MIKFIADKNENISKQIARHSGLPFGVVQKKLRGKEVMINGVRVTGGMTAVGDEVVVFAQVKKFEPKVIFEDDRVLVVDKPRGVESQDFAKQLGVHACHRLDRNTCGVLLCAKSKRNKENIMKDDMGEKTYIAKVFGQPKFAGKSYSAYLQKRADESFVKIYPVCADKNIPLPKGAVKIDSYLKTIKTGSVMSLVECKIKKGKTHQIRAHLAFLGYPIVGDEKYGVAERNKTFKTKYQELYAIKLKTNFKNDFAYLNDVALEAEYEIGV